MDNLYWKIYTDAKRGDVIVLVTSLKFTFKGVEYIIPAGWESDGMSVPRCFWATLSPKINGKTLIPSLIHDFMYENHIGSRAEADAFYRENLIAKGFGRVKSYIVWMGVRIGGGSHWD
jgi:hypothetical protein